MTDPAADFEASLAAEAPPPGLARPLRALWHAARGEWDRAHAVAQEDEADPACAWVHAHLHRVEGDLANARYWYRRAGRPEARGDHAAERRAIAAALAAEPGRPGTGAGRAR
jgi:hypothetical protein